MNKQEMIFELIRLYDEIDTLKRTNERLEANASNSSKRKEENDLKAIDYVMIDKGKKIVFDNSTKHWQKCSAYYDEETGTYSTDSYEKWLEKKIYIDNIPHEISYDDFTNYFRKELMDLYNQEKTKALNDAKGITAKE